MRHHLNWFMERYEHLIDLGIVFAMILIAGVVVGSVFIEGGQPGHPSYFDRPLP